MNDPREISDSDFPSTSSTAEKLLFLSQYAALAPSIHNTQPWIFKIEQDSIILSIDRTRQLPITDPNARQLVISCGAALDHLLLAMRHFKLSPIVSVQSDPLNSNHIATISVGRNYAPNTMETQLFKAMKSRRTSRNLVHDEQIDKKLVDDINLIATSDTLNWTRIQTEKSLLDVQQLVQQADQKLFSVKAYREEVFAWINGVSRDQAEGMSVERLESPDLSAVINLTNSNKQQHAAFNQDSDSHGYLLGVVTTLKDDSSAWLYAGQVLSRILLRSTVDGLSNAFLNQPIDESTTRQLLTDTLALEGYPQYMLLFGQSSSQIKTSRRPVA